MEGRYPNGLLLAITGCSDPAKADEFSNWYNHMHVPDVTAPGIFRHAMRFANTDPDSPAGQYVATYETNLEDVSRAMPDYLEASAKLRETGNRISPLLQTVTVGVFKRLGGEFTASVKPTRGILMVLSNCKDTASEEEFNRWYEDVHIADILDTGAFHTAYRYESLGPKAITEEFAAFLPKAKYLAVYETDSSDPAKAGHELGKARADWQQRGRLFDGIDVTSSLTARRIWPMA